MKEDYSILQSTFFYIPSSNIVALARALNTTPDYLLLGKTEEDPWTKEAMWVLNGIKDPAMRELALKQIK